MKVKQRILSLFLCGAMLFSVAPQMAYATNGQDAGLCEHHTEHTTECGYTPASEGAPCTHECSEESGCIIEGVTKCIHEHDDTCGYKEATEGTPCQYVCEICALQERIDALPDADTLAAMSDEERMEAYNEMLDIYDSIDTMVEGADLLDVARLEAAAEWFNGQTEQVTDDGVNTAEEFAAALTASGEVTLTGSFEISEKMDIVVTSPVTLNLNGNTVTKSYSELNHYFIVIKDGGSLTINGANGGKLEATGSRGYGIQLQSGGTLIVNSGTLEANQEVIDIDDGSSNIKVEINGGVIKNTASDSAINIREGAVVDITGGEIIAPSSNALFVNSYGVSPQINISGGTLTGGQWTVYVSQGADVTVSDNASLTTTGNTGAIHLDGSSYYPSTLLIEGGEIQGDYIAVDADGYSEVTMTGGSITTDRSAALRVSGQATAEISSGTLTGGGTSKTALSGSEEQIMVTGGTFSSNVSDYVYEGLSATKNADGSYTVTRLETVYVSGGGNDANDGSSADKAVATLEHAMNLVADNGTIYVCGTVTVNHALDIDGVTIKRAKNFTDTLISVSGSSANVTVSNSTIDGDNSGSGYLFNVSNSATLTLKDGASLVNNTASAVYVNNSTINMTGGEIKDNSASFGGGIRANMGTLNLSGGTISDNKATGDGGGIRADDSAVKLTGTALTGNTATGAGGGICYMGNGTVTVDSSSITGNTARCGGGIYIEGYSGTATLDMKSGEITENKLALQYEGEDNPYMADGAGIAAYFGYYSTATKVNISGGTISGNTAYDEATDISGAGTAISLNSVVDGSYPSLTLSGTPSISGDVFLWDGEDSGPVITVKDGFAPTAPIEVGANYGKAGTVAVNYPLSMAAADAEALFTSSSADLMLAETDDNNSLEWLQLKRVSFKAPNNSGAAYKNIYVRPGALIDASLAPVEGTEDGSVPSVEGYYLYGWRRYGTSTLWNFESNYTDANTSSMTLNAVYRLNSPTVTVTATGSDSHAGGEITLNVQATHALDGVTYTYQWYKDGAEIAGATESTLVVFEAGSYTVKVTAGSGISPSYSLETSEATESAAVVVTESGHIYATVVTPPTCTQQGYTTYTCKICGDSYVADYTDPTGHSFGTEWESDENGHWQVCETCGATSQKSTHTFEWVTDQEATATEAGSKHEECTVCGYEKAAVEIPATGTTEDPSEPPTDTDKPSGDQTGDKDNSSTGTTGSPQTGDNSNIALWIAVLLAAGVALTGTAAYSRKRKYSK